MKALGCQIRNFPSTLLVQFCQEVFRSQKASAENQTVPVNQSHQNCTDHFIDGQVLLMEREQQKLSARMWLVNVRGELTTIVGYRENLINFWKKPSKMRHGMKSN